MEFLGLFCGLHGQQKKLHETGVILQTPGFVSAEYCVGFQSEGKEQIKGKIKRMQEGGDTHVHRNIIHNRQKLEATHVSTDR